jgi:hypothetical protein
MKGICEVPLQFVEEGVMNILVNETLIKKQDLSNIFFFAVLGIILRASHMIGKCPSTNKLHS